MPVAAHFDRDYRFVMFRCSGNIAISESRRVFDQTLTDPAMEFDQRALWDLRNAMIAEKPRAIPDILDMLHNRHPARVAGARVAILVNEEHDAGVSSLVHKNARTESPTVRVFSCYADAARWLAGNDI
jgi:hypothetical protein